MATDAIVSSLYPHVRRWPRYKINVPLRVIVQLPSKTRIVEGRGTELNEGGMTVFAGVEANPGDCLQVEFTPPYTGQPIRVRGEVRNRTGYNYGLEFRTADRDDDRQVSRLRDVLRTMGSPK